MKLRVEAFFRLGVVLLAVLLGWSFWAGAQTMQPAASLRIVEPKDYSKFREGTNVVLRVEIIGAASDAEVQFFDEERALPVEHQGHLTYLWKDAPRGSYSIVAKVRMSDGVVTSAPVHVRINNAALTFGLDRVKFLTPPFLGIPIWQYCAFLIYVFLAFYISKFIDFAFRAWLKKLASRTNTRLDDLVIELVHGPVKVISFVIFLFFGLDLFTLPPLLESLLEKGFRLLVAFSITYTLLKGVDMMMGYWRERSSGEEDATLDAHLFPIVRKSVKVFIVIVAILVTWQNLSEKPITAILASLSIGGLAIGLAAQDTIANFFGAIVVFIDKPFRVGDFIKLSDAEGTVEIIGLRSTRLRNPQGHLITVPNKTMGNATITNISRRSNIRTDLNFGLTYDTPPQKIERALAILEDVFKNHPMTQDLIMGFNQFRDSSLNIQVIHWWKSTDFRAYLAGLQKMNLTVKERFDAEGINFAFPSQTVYVKQDSKWQLTESGASGQS